MAFLGDYEKIQRIGEGAFATVYKVRHAQLDYIRAIKVSKGFIEDTEDKAWKTFLAECKMLLRIGNGSHPNIVRIYQPRLLEHRAVVEMDCIEGISLHEYVKKIGFVPIKEFNNFAHQIVGALAYCHVDLYKFQCDPVIDGLTPDPNDGLKYNITPQKEKELIAKYCVVHNDLHSGNIMRRDYDGNYVLLDFGLAIQDTHCVKSSSRFDGAIEYCAPEKLDHGIVQPASDVYALGILLYEVLAGQVPFPYDTSDGSTPESARNRVYQQQLHSNPGPILPKRKAAFEATHPGKKYQRDYPEALDKIIDRCLAKDPDKRYHNAKELLNDIENIIKISTTGGTAAGGGGTTDGGTGGGTKGGTGGGTKGGTKGGTDDGKIIITGPHPPKRNGCLKALKHIFITLLCLGVAAAIAWGGWELYNRFINNPDTPDTPSEEEIWNDDWRKNVSTQTETDPPADESQDDSFDFADTLVEVPVIDEYPVDSTYFY